MTLVDITTITLKAADKKLLDRYARKNKMSRSAVIRLAIKEFFLSLGETA
jgi:predicted transcriptional regulator